MEFSFSVNPENDLAIGVEVSTEAVVVEDEFAEDDFDFSECDPMISTEAKPGSEDKVKMLAARYAAGVPLWHDSDCYDHGPQSDLDLIGEESDQEIELDLT